MYNEIYGEIWEDIVKQLEALISKSDTELFISAFSLLKAENNKFTFAYNNKYVYKDFVKRNINALRIAAGSIYSRMPDIKFKYIPEKKQNLKAEKNFSMQQPYYLGETEKLKGKEKLKKEKLKKEDLKENSEDVFEKYSKEKAFDFTEKNSKEKNIKEKSFNGKNVLNPVSYAGFENSETKTDYKKDLRQQRKKNYKMGIKNIIASFLCLVLAFVLTVVSVNVIANQNFKENFYSVSLNNTYDNFRVIQITDLHNTKYGKSNKKLTERIKKLNPDIIALTGDCVNYNGDINDVKSVCFELAKIAPTYYIYGNNEWRRAFNCDTTLESIDKITGGNNNSRNPKKLYSLDNGLKKELESTGVKVLFNETDTLEIGSNKIKIFGTLTSNPSAFWPYAGKEFNKFINENNSIKLFLCHEPLIFETLKENYWGDLAMCGDTHGGIVRLPGVGALYSRNFGLFPEKSKHLIYGKYTVGESEIIVSSGLTNKGIPRIFNQPELVIADVNKY